MCLNKNWLSWRECREKREFARIVVVLYCTGCYLLLMLSSELVKWRVFAATVDPSWEHDFPGNPYRTSSSSRVLRRRHEAWSASSSCQSLNAVPAGRRKSANVSSLFFVGCNVSFVKLSFNPFIQGSTLYLIQRNPYPANLRNNLALVLIVTLPI